MNRSIRSDGVARAADPGDTPTADRTGPRPAPHNPKPRLPIAEAEWNSYRLVKRGRRVRVGSAPLKAFYLSLLGFSQPLACTDIGTFRAPLHVILHDLESGERAFYAKRRQLTAQGLLIVTNRGAHASEYKVIASRTLAAAPPPISAESAEMTPRLISAESAEIISAESADVRSSSCRRDQQQQQDPPDLDEAPPLPPSAHHATRPTEKQLRGIADMGDELRTAGVDPAGPDHPVTRSQASEVFRARKAQVNRQRARAHRL